MRMQGKHNAAGARNTMNQDNPSLRIRTMYAQKPEKYPVVKLGPDIKAKIGMQLRLMYGEIVDHADDLVQEALLRAWANMGSFQPGTNMSAWLFTILRNLFRSEYRKRRREVEDV